MTLFYCPVRVRLGVDAAHALQEELNGRTWALFTSPGWIERGLVADLAGACGAPKSTVASLRPNPRLSDVVCLSRQPVAADVLVAVGGGSVIDASKGFVAMTARSSGGAAAVSEHLAIGTPLPASLGAMPLIAVPTTSGTGSELTRWATIWGDDGSKHSLAHHELYPASAILDPQLTQSMPRPITLASGLDALSHAMEAVWNLNHTLVTDALAATAIAALRTFLPQALVSPGDLRARAEVQIAAMLAGLAMGTTRSALAHSISYPFTSEFELPHGLACSFALAEVARYNAPTGLDRMSPIARGLGCQPIEVPQQIEAFFSEIGLGEALRRFVDVDTARCIRGRLINPSRADNNIRAADECAARMIAERAIRHHLGDRL